MTACQTVSGTEKVASVDSQATYDVVGWPSPTPNRSKISGRQRPAGQLCRTVDVREVKPRTFMQGCNSNGVCHDVKVGRWDLQGLPMMSVI